MKLESVKGKTVSQMTLGTVQLGMNYGIANKIGKPDLQHSFQILETALTNGVTSIDTARAYGDSEKIIGDFLKQYKGETPYITTKVPEFFGDDSASDAEIEKFIITNVETSLENLGQKKVNNIMIHNGENLYHHADATAKVMGSLVKRGYTDIVGASVYTGDELEKLMSHEEYSATQIPMSIFDQRLIRDGHVKKLHDRGFTVFVRSVFLQGLFFLEPEKITDPILLKEAKPGLIKLSEYAEKEGMSIAELAISFMRDIPGITSLVLGADTSNQVLENDKFFDAPPISEKTVDALHKTFANTDIPEIMKVLSRPKK